MATVDLRQLIINEANSQGVPPAIALAVASQESGMTHWLRNGQVVTSSKGAIGVMQLMPATASALGVDPYDVFQNIRGGVSYLKQMFNQFGDWSLALAAYNWGPGNLQRSIYSGGSIPASVQTYVNRVGGNSGIFSAGAPTPDAIASSSPGDAGSQDVLSLADSIQVSAPDTNMGAVLLFGGLALAALMLFWD